ncbi:MAG: fibronectin type III domain-containing protein [Acidimicrobiia bacterium]
MATAVLLGGVLGPVLAEQSAHALTTGDTVDLRVLLIGDPGGAATDPTTAAWAAGLTTQGVAYTEADPTGTIPNETVTLPTLTSSATHGLYNAVVFAGKPADFAAGQLTTLFGYESTFGIRQIDGDFVAGYPAAGNLGLNAISDAQNGAAISSTTATLTAAGLSAFPALNGPVPIDAGVFGYSGTTAGVTLPTGATETPLLNDASGNVLIGVYQHPTAAQDPTDLQAGVAEMTIGFNYNQNMTQWLLLGPGLIDWVTGGAHVGLYRNYATIHVDDQFTPDDTWDIATHANDYTPADALRMGPVDVDNLATWSRTNNFRLDMLFNGGNSTTNNATASAPDPLLAEWQKIDPATGKPYSDDVGWLNHTWDHAYLDVGCATTNYIEAEVQQNTNWAASAPGATPGTGGLGLTSTTDLTASPYGAENPTTLVPGGHSGFANLIPGSADAVDPPDLDDEVVATTGGTFAAGTYVYALTDQFNAADSTSIDQSSASVTTPIAVPVDGTVTLTWQAVCHAANYLVYRENVATGAWTLVGSLPTPATATPPATLTANGASTTDTTGGGMQQQTFVDTGAAGTAQSGFTPPTTQDAHETAWEQNPYFLTAMDALNMTSVGTDASKPYPNPATDEFGIGVGTYTGTEYPASAAFPDGTFEGVPRHPINIYYNTSTEAQAVDEYNTLYVASGDGGNCTNSSTTTCLTAPATFQDIVNSVVSGMFTNMVNNDPRPTYVHQTNLMGTAPATIPATAPNTSTAVGDGLLYSVLNPLLTEYHTYYNATVPYQQPDMGQIGQILNEQSAWATAQPAGTASSANTVSASETGANITITNTGTATVTVPVTVPLGYEYNGAVFGTQYGGSLSAWQTLTAGQSIVISALPPAVTSAATANAQVGSPFSFAVTTSGSPAPTVALTAGTLPAGLTFAAGLTAGTATIAGTPAAGTGGTYPITLTATNVAGVATQAFSLFVAQPSIGIVPSTSPPSYAVAGTPMTYSYQVTDTGNVPLIAVGVTDTLAGLSAISCPPGALAAGANETCTAHYTVTQADVDAGGITDAATASGKAPSTTVVHATGGVDTPARQTPAIAVAPSANPGSFFSAATPLQLSYLVTNSGNVTLHGVGVTDPLAGVSAISCPSPTLAPAGTESCTASYTTTQANVTAGGVTDAPTATGTPPTGPAVDGSTHVVFPFWTAPTITSAELTTIPRKTKVNFTFKAKGIPSPLLTLTGKLPNGLRFTQGLGTATLKGTVNAAGTYPLTLTATSAAGTTDQRYSMHVTAPELASGVLAQPGNAQATVKWTPPVLHGGLPVTGYVVTPYLGHTALSSHMFHSTAKHEVITGLSNGRQYRFKVAAMNKLGTGPNSVTTAQINALGVGPTSPASPAIRIGTPHAPADVTAAATNPGGSLVVRFSAASGNGSPILGYTAVCVSHNGGTTRSAATGGNVGSIVVTGVTLNKTYTCSVAATNRRGSGPAGISNQVLG